MMRFCQLSRMIYDLSHYIIANDKKRKEDRMRKSWCTLTFPSCNVIYVMRVLEASAFHPARATFDFALQCPSDLRWFFVALPLSWRRTRATSTAVARLWTSKSQVAGADGSIENFPERNVPNIPVRHVRSDTSRFLIHSMKLTSGWNMKKHNIPHGKGLSNLAFKSSVACYIHTGRDILIEICVSHRAWWILSHGNTLISQWI